MVDLLYPFWYILPSYFANSSPVLVSKIEFLAKYNFPLDLKLKFFDGQRILGDGKTFFGFLLGVLVGTIVGVIQGNFMLGFLLSIGTMVGDSAGSFLKRRLKIERGKNSPLIDDLIFLISALAFAWQVAPIEFLQVVELLILTPVLHRLANILAHSLKLKEVPW